MSKGPKRSKPDTTRAAIRRWIAAGLLVATPLAVGGVLPLTVPIVGFAVCGALLVGGGTGDKDSRSTTPLGLAAWFALAAWTIVHWLPTPWVAQRFAPTLDLTLAPLGGAKRISVLPGATAMEAVRTVTLGGAFLLGFRVRRAWVCGSLAVSGTLVALLGFAHLLAGTTKIWWVYEPVEKAADAAVDGIVTSFVNPNHAAAFLLLTASATVATWWDLRAAAQRSTDIKTAHRPADLANVALLGLGVQLAALAMTHSRLGLALAGVGAAAIALVLAARKNRGRGNRAGIHVKMAGAIGLALVGAALFANRLGAQPLQEVVERKFETVQLALKARTYSPWLGTGRGTFVDLSRLADDAPQAFAHAHVESLPVTLFLEWGPPICAVALGTLVWWGAKAWPRSSSAVARRAALVGLCLALAHNLAGFSLEFLGVGLPAAVLAGALSGKSERGRRWTDAAVGAAVFVGACAGLYLAPWTDLPTRNFAKRTTSGELTYEEAIVHRPLETSLHTTEARRAYESGENERAAMIGEFAGDVDPTTMDGPLLAGAAYRRMGEPEKASRQTQRALERLTDAASTELVSFIAGTYAPEEMGEIAPDRPVAFNALAVALLRDRPAHARGLALHRYESRASDELATKTLAWAAVRLERRQEALLYAEELVKIDPGKSEHHVLLVAALRLNDARETEIRDTLTTALEAKLDDPGRLHESLVHSYAEQAPIDSKQALVHADEMVSADAPSEGLREQRRALRDAMRERFLDR